MTQGVATAIELFPALKDKCAVRLIGRLNNVKEQSRVQQEKQGFINEVVDSWSGETRRRQDYINKHLVDVVEETIDQLTDVMNSVALNSRTLCMVVDELKNLQLHTEVIAHEVISVKGKLAQLEDKVHSHFCVLTEKVAEIDCRLKARDEMDRVFHRWESGALNALPFSLRGYGVLEQLWWGDLGFYIQQYPGQEADKLIQFLRDRAVTCFAKDMEVKSQVRVPREVWLNEPSDSVMVLSGVMQGIELLSDWATEDNAPFVTMVCNSCDGNQALLSVSHLISAERLGRELVGEVFVNRTSA